MKVLVGREAEHDEINGLFASVAADRVASLLFVGGPGVGKTTLLLELQRQARERGFLVLRARASALERGFEFGVLSQLFEPLAVDTDASGRFCDSADTARSTRRAGGQGPAGSSAADPERLPAWLHGLTPVAALCRSKPVLLAVDDLHEADSASLGWLIRLTERIASLPLAVAGAMCPPGPSDEAAGALLRRMRAVEPAGLGPEAVHTLVETLLPAADAAELAPSCREVTAGNPFLLRRLLHGLGGRAGATPEDVRGFGSPSVSREVLARLHRTTPAAASLVRAAAVLGNGAERAAAGELACLSGPERDDACELLVRLGMLRDGRSLRFTHSIVLTSVAADMTVVGRGLAHARAAETLYVRGAPPERIAAQLLQASPVTVPWAVQVLREAAAAASRRGATDAAVTYLRRAVEIRPAVGLRTDLAKAEQEAALPGADTGLVRLLSETEDPRLRARIALALCRTVLLRDGFTASTAVLDPALDALGVVAPREAADKRARTVAWALSLGTPPRLTGIWLADRPWDHMTGHRADALLACQEVVAGGSPQRAAELARRALAAGQPAEHSEHAFVWTAAGALLAAGMLDEAEEHVTRGLLDAQRHGWIMSEFVGHSCRARAELARGRLTQAVRSAQAGRTALGRMGSLMPEGDTLGRAVGLLAECLVERGDLEEARHLLDRHGFGDGCSPDRPEQYRLVYARGRLRLACGDASGASEDFLMCGSHVGDESSPAVTGPWRGYAALACLRLGRKEEAARLARSEVAAARGWGTPQVLGNALVLAAACLPRVRRDLLEEAVALLDASPCRHILAAALTALGEVVLPSHRERGVELLYRGFELAAACEDATVLDRARVLLRGVGIRPRGPRTGAAALTGRERQILEFALQGMSNQKIADLHFLTRRTVEQHLSRGYRKLGVTGRAELTEDMLRGGG
ncbi:helix-turn-helix transcriptional regulator [Streptomyces nitrosporeus]|uniref:helix-turn-helix transcriptional regulator n=1 Tax=Streptomyces nitrosporeus TaxID=28894 RepID=UPI00332830BF